MNNDRSPTRERIREKDGVPFEVKLVYAPLVDLYTNIALVAQDQLGQLGIKVDVQSEEWSSYLTNVLLPQKYDLTIVGFGGGTEVDGIAYNILYSKNDNPGSGFNLASYVNPKVDHPRWSQATERRIGEFGRRDTLPFNGYADQVADLYAGMDLRANF